jgi:hypothetical protein
VSSLAVEVVAWMSSGSRKRRSSRVGAASELSHPAWRVAIDSTTWQARRALPKERPWGRESKYSVSSAPVPGPHSYPRLAAWERTMVTSSSEE